MANPGHEHLGGRITGSVRTKPKNRNAIDGTACAGCTCGGGLSTLNPKPGGAHHRLVKSLYSSSGCLLVVVAPTAATGALCQVARQRTASRCRLTGTASVGFMLYGGMFSPRRGTDGLPRGAETLHLYGSCFTGDLKP